MNIFDNECIMLIFVSFFLIKKAESTDSAFGYFE